jgi:hypothetical protein
MRYGTQELLARVNATDDHRDRQRPLEGVVVLNMCMAREADAGPSAGPRTPARR